PLLHRRRRAQPLRRCDPGRDRETPRPVVDGVRASARLRFRRRGQVDLKPFALAALLWIFGASAGWPQPAAPPQPQPPSSQPAAPQPAAPPAAEPAPPAAPENPGLLNEMGKALEKSLSILPTLKSPSETIDDL